MTLTKNLSFGQVVSNAVLEDVDIQELTNLGLSITPLGSTTVISINESVQEISSVVHPLCVGNMMNKFMSYHEEFCSTMSHVKTDWTFLLAPDWILYDSNASEASTR